MRCVSFTIPELYAGFGECRGILYDEQNVLRFEFQVQDKLAGLLKSRVKSVRIPVEQIVSVQLTKGWFGSTWLGVKIVIQSSSLEAFKELPGATQGKVELTIARADVATAEAFVDGLYASHSVSPSHLPT
jgi:hypothetical protein